MVALGKTGGSGGGIIGEGGDGEGAEVRRAVGGTFELADRVTDCCMVDVVDTCLGEVSSSSSVSDSVSESSPETTLFNIVKLLLGLPELVGFRV